MENFKFTTISQAKKDTKLSYLAKVNVSPKLRKNGEVSKQHTYGLYLAPHKLSGYNVCKQSTAECRMGCLYASGHTAMEIISGGNRIQNARKIKTQLLFEQKDFFMQWLIAEINAAKINAEKQDFGFSVRLNCTSDVEWEKIKLHGLNIFEIFPDVQFYDYTKNVLKFDNKAKNYHLTYSYTGLNWDKCKTVMNLGFNIAMVFNVKNEKLIPAMYKGYEVINGDETDYRVNDSKGVIIGLKWKRIANKVNEKKVLNSVFVINPANMNVQDLQKVMVAS